MKLAIPMRLGLFALVAVLLVVSCTPEQAKQAGPKPLPQVRDESAAQSVIPPGIPYDRPLTPAGGGIRSPEEPLLYYYIEEGDPIGYSGNLSSVIVSIGQLRSGK
jgi:hypothetical protein